MATITDQGVCVRVWDWSETSQTVSIFTREHGIVRGIAKGAKREHARFSGGIELGTRGELIARIKSAEGLSLMIAWDLQEVFPGLRRSVESFHAGMLLFDVVQRAVQELDPHPRLFDAFANALREIGGGRERAVITRFLWTTLSETGHKPELERDVVADRPIELTEVYTFVPGLGGITTARGEIVPGSGGGWRVRGETVALLRELGSEREAAYPDRAYERALRLLAAYFGEVARTELPTLPAYLDTIGVPQPSRGE